MQQAELKRMARRAGNAATGWLKLGTRQQEGAQQENNGETPHSNGPNGAKYQPGLFSAEQLARAARELAQAQQVVMQPSGGRALRSRLEAAARRIEGIYAELQRDMNDEQAAQKVEGEPLAGAEWLLDNIHVVKNVIAEVYVDLPTGYYRQLPKLINGPLAGYPRVYSLARALLSGSDSMLSVQRIDLTVDAYQEALAATTPLTLGELWSVAIMLRLSLVESLAYLLTVTDRARQSASAADRWAYRLLEMADAAHDQPLRVPRDLRESKLIDDPVFAARLAARLRDEGTALLSVIEWIGRRQQAHGSSVTEAVRHTHQLQTDLINSIGNVITSMRRVSAINWAEFVERHGLTEHILREDPAGAYPRMDFASRDRYRHMLEALARRARQLEDAVARAAISCAAAGSVQFGQNDRRAHVGYYLVDAGRSQLEKAIGYSPDPLHRLERFTRAHATPLYLGALTAATAGMVAVAARLAKRSGAGVGGSAGVAALVAIPASTVAVSLVNQFITGVSQPTALPKLDLDSGIPREARTVVVVPLLLSSAEGLREALEQLEVRYLANSDPSLHFALLTDLVDAPEAELPGDDALVRQAAGGIEALNARYGGDRFFLFHRRRRWNEAAGVWMGWERKRGKLMEFNRLLRGQGSGDYVVQVGALELLPEVRYVITLDADTELPAGTARRLVGTMEHPLNRPLLNNRHVVAQGYGILQPRVGVTALAGVTPFARLLSGENGIDPYTTAISDVYQDLFRRGIYIGKGIYDVDAFMDALAERVPENSVLSHDLLEGSYARAGFASDIVIYEDFPERYSTYRQREERWLRGDWQIMRWLWPRVPVASGVTVSNPLPRIARWQVFDNLRRSTQSPGTLALLLAGWTVLPGSGWLWTAAGLLPRALPVLTSLLAGLPRKPAATPWTRHIGYLARETGLGAGNAGLQSALLVDNSIVSLQAVARSLWRVYISHQKQLEWQTSADSRRVAGSDLPGYLRRMWLSPVLAGATALLAWRRGRLPAAAPVLISWALSPLIAWRLSQPERVGPRPLEADEKAELRRTARKTWRYFEDFVNAEDNWLVPDNYQEVPRGFVARRTSPTNLGLALLATFSAHDFGYLSRRGMITRLDAQLASMERLERFRGHFYNWYDTEKAAPLEPRYVSMVDSGNLAACLVVLKQGALALLDKPIAGPDLLAGLGDTANMLAETLEATPTGAGVALSAFRRLLASPVSNLHAAGWVKLCTELLAQARRVQDALPPHTPGDGETHYWAAALVAQARAICDDIAELFGWTHVIDTAPPLLQPLLAPSQAGGRHANGPLPSLAENITWCLHQTQSLQRWRHSVTRLELDEPTRKAALAWLDQLAAAVARGWTGSEAIHRQLRDLANRSANMLEQMRFELLLDEERGLFSIGYNVAEGRRDPSFYDLLASEARLGSYVAIARGQAPVKHWFQLGRTLAPVEWSQALVSWSGTMFEYLMPNLMLPLVPQTLLDQTCRAAVLAQRDYGRRHHVPWGISEAAFNTVDGAQNYQYHAFGVPGLGLKRGLADDLVVAPYATVLALDIDAPDAVANMRRLADLGMDARYGFYESIDYTPGRREPALLPAGAPPPRQDRRSGHDAPGGAIVRTFMAHHQGMSLLAIANTLFEDRLVRLFMDDPQMRSMALLLEERIPRQAPLTSVSNMAAPPQTPTRVPQQDEQPNVAVAQFSSADTARPLGHLLSNGALTVLLTNAGGGYTQWRPPGGGDPIMLTRWREDNTREGYGTFFYLRDLRDGKYWSLGATPLGAGYESYGGEWSAESATIWRRQDGIEARMQVVVSPDDDVELRSIRLLNYSPGPRDIEVTSYAEVLLAPLAADLAHPAFQKLFVQTEFVEQPGVLLATRRARKADENPPWLLHLLAASGDLRGGLHYESSREAFLGRDRTPATPQALDGGPAPVGSTGAVLDPVVSLRRRVRLAPGATATLLFVTGVAADRAKALDLAMRYAEPGSGPRAAQLATIYSSVRLGELGLSRAAALRASRLASHLIFPDPALRPRPEILARNTLGQSGLWTYGISGDLPILLLVVGEPAHTRLLQEVVAAHSYWRAQGFSADVVILNQSSEGYLTPVNDAFADVLRRGSAAPYVGKKGGFFLLNAGTVPEADQLLLRSAARVVLLGRHGNLDQQLRRSRSAQPARVAGLAERQIPAAAANHTPQAGGGLFNNGLGGFSPDGREYTIELNGGDATPAPWINVLTNPQFGCLVSESALGSSWWLNSRENRLTPWSNDPVSDPPAEVIYLRDEQSGAVWSPTALPVREGGRYRVRHGWGYSVFEHSSHDIAAALTMFVPTDAPLRVAWLTLRNSGTTPRRISATSYCEWVMGVNRDPSSRFVITAWDGENGAITARNPYNNEFAGRLAFVAANSAVTGYSADRSTFLGRNGTLSAPAALASGKLDRQTGAGLDPCAALMAPLELAPGATASVAFFLGETADEAEMQKLLAAYRGADAVATALEKTKAFWRDILTRVQVQTPDPALDTMLNGWLLYQSLACRIWARSAFYQGGGAYGFRDQLQDVIGFLPIAPEVSRDQIVRAAQHQFKEGDVQHWWHPPTGRGVRTHISDDMLWLPYVVERYVAATGDSGLLDEQLHFLDAPELAPEQEDSYGFPQVSAEIGTLYEHCVRAIRRGATSGPHGLPLMGAGDWNDGMNRVGRAGKGESIWLGWFLAAVLERFAPLAQAHGDAAFAAWCQSRHGELMHALEANAWDGDWYLRAFFDDGTPLGSHTNEECRIDSIAQSWAVLAGGDAGRAREAMGEVGKQLVRQDERLVLLFTPPFDKSPLDPGYIKGYVPGVRENGGQYTHAATWVGFAFAQLRDGAQAHYIFDLLNPITHSRDAAGRERYKVEPYVVAADVYSLADKVGRGGWTWYTGSAAWLYRLGVEAMLGMRRESAGLRLDPVVPPAWPGFNLTYRNGLAVYNITVDNSAGKGQGVAEITLDGAALPDNLIPLDGAAGTHEAHVRLG